MKKVFYYSLVCFILSSCYQETDNTNEKTLSFTKPTISQIASLKSAMEDNVLQKTFGPCDNAARIQIYHTGTFRFKRPKFDCESGFWFCSTPGIWMGDCFDSAGNLIYSAPLASFEPSKSGQQNGVDFRVEIVYSSENTVFMKYDLNYFNSNEYSTSDLEFLSVDEELLLTNGQNLVLGQYPTFEYDGFLIAEVNIE